MNSSVPVSTLFLGGLIPLTTQVPVTGMRCSNMSRYDFRVMLFWIGFTLLGSTCFSQLSYVRQLTVNDGLPQGQVRGMVQDKQGFIWIASDGLSRYDGRNFINYRHVAGDTTTLSDNDIRDLQIDDRDNLWIVYASNEADVLNAATGKLRHLSAEPAFQWLKSLSNPHINFTVRQVGSQYFAAICDNILAFDFMTGKHWQVTLPGSERLVALGKEIAGKTILATTGGIYRLQGSRPERLYQFSDLPDSVHKRWDSLLYHRKDVGEVTVDKSGKWVIPAVGGVYRYSPQQHTATYTGDPAGNRNPYTLVTATDGNVYFILKTGIYKISGGVPELVYSNETTGTRYSILLADRSGMLWAGTDVHGISFFRVHPDNFHSTPYNVRFAEDVLQSWVPATPWTTTYSPYTMRLSKDTGGHIWLLNQVNRWQDREKEIAQRYAQLYRLQPSGAIVSNRIPQWPKPRYFTFDAFNRCWMILEDTNQRRVLAKKNLQTGTAAPFVSVPGGWKDNGYLTSIHRYIAYLADYELRLIDTATAACTIFPKEQLGVSGLLLMAYPDPHHNNILWIATKGSGIVKLDITTGRTTRFTDAEGLPNNTVYYIAPDKKGRFWCSSNKGLFRFDPANGSVISFTVKDGLQGDEFNRYHFLETPDGHFYFGGTEGYTWFHPDSIHLDSYQTPVVITALQVNNIPLSQLGPRWKDSLPSHLQSIHLPHYQNQLTFSFAGLQYDAPEKLQYRYRLQGIDDGWIHAGYRAEANYASIPPGHYTLLLNATNTSGFWSSHITKLDILISPPWWRTGWMYSLYALLIIAAAWFFFRIRLRRLQLAQQVVLKQKEAEQAHTLEETKSRFFANITHELRTPLTLILSPVQRQLQQGAGAYTPLLEGVYQNSQTLLRLINQLLDMSKLEEGRMPLTLYRGNVVQFIESLLSPFCRQAATRNITFLFSVNDNRVNEHWPDSGKLPTSAPLPHDPDRTLNHAAPACACMNCAHGHASAHTAPVRALTNRNEPAPAPVCSPVNGCKGEAYIPVCENTNRSKGIPATQSVCKDRNHHDEAYLFDSDKLEKVLYNLLSNAFKFTPEGGSISLMVSQQPAVGQHASIDGPGIQPGGKATEKNTFQIQVSDSGIGITPEHLPHIFDRFYQVNTSTTRRYEGTGIGLSLVKEFTGLMGGTITAESTPGNGSVFTLTLPLTNAADSKAPAVNLSAESSYAAAGPEKETDSPATETNGKPLVLIADDNESLRNFIAASLLPHYRTLTAINGEAGLQIATADLPELIISDVMMPVMDGYEFCRKIKENPLTGHIGFILLTARTADESRVSGLRSGADHYICKPFMVEELLLTVANLLNRQQQVRVFYNRQLQRPAEQLPRPDEVEDVFLQSVYAVIESNLDNAGLDVEYLAKELAVSRRTLNRKLAAIAGTSANELIRHYRLKKAAGLLLSGQGVSESAYATGFTTPSYFSQCFREIYGQSPLQYAGSNRSPQN